MKINVFTDGGARGNPGTAGFGVVIYGENKKIIFQQAKHIGIKTNNEAEYLALLSALEWIKDNKNNFNISQIDFHSDSQLMVRQIQGVYKVKAGNLLPLFNQAKHLLPLINLPCKFIDVRREYNKLADSLANQAMDQKL